jgi:hypothetical protein
MKGEPRRNGQTFPECGVPSNHERKVGITGVLFRRTVQLPVRGKHWAEVASGWAEPGAEREYIQNCGRVRDNSFSCRCLQDGNFPSGLGGCAHSRVSVPDVEFSHTSQAIGAACSPREAACPLSPAFCIGEPTCTPSQPLPTVETMSIAADVSAMSIKYNTVVTSHVAREDRWFAAEKG